MTQPNVPSPGSIDDIFDDHTKYAGDTIPDPWDDPEQTDWPQEGEASDGMGTHSEHGPSSD